ncbi:uncharacterized protein LOC122531654 [Frieseomelitta varia]|uniref:uncharacterized protein LOC122531654 n=1 Tax=Frieseomelitta varia TaxID=561572 RepID=UPI001CB6A39C|nr:uncharacterized protein LOC122531654 [Frieseomelitta varia]
MDDDDTDEKRESLTLVNKLSRKESSKTRLLVSSKLAKPMSTRLETRQRNSTDDSDTVECASENEVENIPRDEEAIEPLVTDEKGNRISGGRDRRSINVPEESQSIATSRQQIVTRTTSLRVNEEGSRVSRYTGTKLGLFHRSPQSSSSQEEYEPEVKSLSKIQRQQQQQQQHLLTAGTAGHVTARSMESLRTSRNFLSADERYIEDSKSLESLSLSSESHVASSKSHYRSFLTSSSKDVRRIVTVESKSSDNLHREESLNAEVRRGLFANTGLERKIPQHLSLPPPSSVFSLTSPGGSDRKITILSPHSPIQSSEFQFTAQTLKSRRKKAIVLPRLVLPRSDSEVFLE